MKDHGRKAGRNGRPARPSQGLKGPQTWAGARVHGVYSLEKLLRGRKIDGRTSLGQALKQRRREFVEHYGGRDALPVTKGAVLDRAMFKITLLQTIESWALTTRTALIDADGQLPPILANAYLPWSESLRRDLLALGLERVARDVTPTLRELLAEAAQDDGGEEAQ